jgi:hypothetical protein
MAIQCPYCGYGMALKGGRPGRFGPRCPKCTKKFLLVISDDPSQPPFAHAVEDKRIDTISVEVAVALGIQPPKKGKKGGDAPKAG